MRRRVEAEIDLVVPLAHDRAIEHDDAADRVGAGPPVAGPRQRDGAPHEGRVVAHAARPPPRRRDRGAPARLAGMSLVGMWLVGMWLVGM